MPAGIVVPMRPRMLLVILSNLLDNSLRYAGRGATFRIAARLRGRHRSCSRCPTTARVSTPQDVPRLFERFFRSDRSRTTRGTGPRPRDRQAHRRRGRRHRRGGRRPRRGHALPLRPAGAAHRRPPDLAPRPTGREGKCSNGARRRSRGGQAPILSSWHRDGTSRHSHARQGASTRSARRLVAAPTCVEVSSGRSVPDADQTFPVPRHDPERLARRASTSAIEMRSTSELAAHAARGGGEFAAVQRTSCVGSCRLGHDGSRLGVP